MIEVTILVDNLDYESIADYLVPALAEKMQKEGKGGILGNVFANNADMATSMARTILDKMPQDKKDELVVQLLNKNRDKLLKKATSIAAKKNVGVQICDVSARKF